MRLLDVHQLKLKQFPNDKTRPSYAILSHTWGEGEVSFQDLQAPAVASSMAGYAKIEECCKVAIEDGFEYVWIDTCCIDKTSSAELSEAINSMYNWYQSAEVCYAYLSDMRNGDNPSDSNSSFSKSRWFTRGWTLQELLAPKTVMFYDRDWVDIGTKRTLQEDISRITGIPPEVLLNERDTNTYCIAQRMSWVAKRETEKAEDIAYCLMGIFEINMPTLYGEGKKAFIRLQYEIMKVSDDHSLFAWASKPSGPFAPDSQNLGICGGEAGRQAMEDLIYNPRGRLAFGKQSGLLSSSPQYFEYSGKVKKVQEHFAKHSFSMTNKGLHIKLPRVRIPLPYGKLYQVVLNCATRPSNHLLTIFVKLKPSGQYSRVFTTWICTAEDLEYDPEPVELYVKENYPEDSKQETVDNRLNYQFRLVENPAPHQGYILQGASSSQISEQKVINLLVLASTETDVAYIIIGDKHDPSARYLVFLAVTAGGFEPEIFCNIRTEENDIKEAIATFHKYGHDRVSLSLFQTAYDWLTPFNPGDQIIHELPSGRGISIHFRKGPQPSYGVHICRLIVEFATPTKLPILPV